MLSHRIKLEKKKNLSVLGEKKSSFISKYPLKKKKKSDFMECSHPSPVLAHFGTLGRNHWLRLSRLGIPIHQHPSKKLQGKERKKSKINFQLPSTSSVPVPDSDEIRDFVSLARAREFFPILKITQYIENNPTWPPTAFQDLS